jgi:hypothetical protein
MSHAPCCIRYGTPGCKWQIALIDLDESETERLRESFREHCIESHGLSPDDPNCEALLDLKNHTITLMEK